MIIEFWDWFLGKNKAEGPGYQRVVNEWLFFHMFIGLILTLLTVGKISDLAKVLIIPLSGALIGITFAWSGNISSLVMSKEISDLTSEDEDKFYDFIYTFQLAALVVISSISLWAISALGFLDNTDGVIKYVVTFILFTITSCSIREGWNVITGVSTLTAIRFKVRKLNKNAEQKNNRI